MIPLDTTSFEQEDSVGVQNADAGVTLLLGAQGTDIPIDVEAFATLRLTRSDRGGESHDVPLYLWNSDAIRDMNAYGVDPVLGDTGVVEWLPFGQIQPQLIEGSGDVIVSDIDRRSAHLDVYFPGRLARELEVALKKLNVLLATEPPPDLSTQAIQQLRSFLSGVEPGVLSSQICVEIRPSEPLVRDRFVEDNTMCTALAFELPPDPPAPPEPVPLPPPAVFEPTFSTQSHPVLFDQTFRVSWDGRTFGFSVDFNASTSADNRCAILNTLGRVPVSVFAAEVGFVKVDARAQTLSESGKVSGEPGRLAGTSTG